MSLAEELRAILKRNGADIIGFADLRPVSSEIIGHLPFGISIAVALNVQIISQIREGPTKEYYAEYERVNRHLNMLGRQTAEFLREKGHKALWFAATHAEEQSNSLRAGSGFDPETLSTCLPHKTVATRAGLGWIGKCALLVTKAFGSAIRFCTVLTDAILPCGEPVNVTRCGDCTSCVTACPGGAPSGRDWQPGLQRKAFFDAFACQKAAKRVMAKRTGIEYPVCGICIAVCPWTQKHIKSVVTLR